jgi:integrase/recombinase XerD
MASIPRARVPGPLAPFADGFRAELDRRGYTPGSREYKINEMSVLSRWLEGCGLGVGDLSSDRVGAWLTDFGANHRRTPTLRAMRPLLEWLRSEGLIGADPATPQHPLDDLMDDYRQWMVDERDLAARTVGRCDT